MAEAAVRPAASARRNKARVVTSRRSLRILWPDVVGFAIVLTIGLARLPTPFGGDQALNLLMGQLIHDGGAPYRDLWDLKHIGIFYFFAAAGSLFGFDEIGVHLFELVWMIGLAFLARAVAGRWLATPRMASVAPLATAGVYFAVAGERYLTQTEAVVSLPLLLSLYCAAVGGETGSRATNWYLASGLAGGIVLIFKLPYVALPMMFWVLAWWKFRAQKPEARKQPLRRAAIAVLIGVLIPVLATVWYLIVKGSGAVAMWTYVRHPAEAWESTRIDPARLLRATRAFAALCAPLFVFAAVGLLDAWRSRRNVASIALGGWLILGTVLIGVQAISWWDYHYFLLLTPLGLLAVRGIGVCGTLLGSWARWVPSSWAGAIGTLMMIALFWTPLASAARVVFRFWSSRPLPFTGAAVAAYQARYYPTYAAIRSKTAFLRSRQSHPGPIYVFDSPIYYFHAQRRPSVPLLAPWFHPTDRLWGSLRDGLEQAPPAYVRVSPEALEAIVENRPDVRRTVEALGPWIARHYEVLRQDETGTWHVRRDLAGPR